MQGLFAVLVKVQIFVFRRTFIAILRQRSHELYSSFEATLRFHVTSSPCFNAVGSYSERK
jgi:hypothetical protein